MPLINICFSLPDHFRKFDYKPNRGKSWGTVSVEVKIGSAWHPVWFKMGFQGFKQLASLAYEERAYLLDTITQYPLINRLIPEPGMMRKRGTSASFYQQQAWTTARWSEPILRAWADGAFKSQDSLYRQAVQHMKQAGYSARDPAAVTAFLIERNVCNARKVWPGRAPMKNLRGFYATLKKHPLQYSPSRRFDTRNLASKGVNPTFDGRSPGGVKPTSDGPSVGFPEKVQIWVKGILKGDAYILAHQDDYMLT